MGKIKIDATYVLCPGLLYLFGVIKWVEYELHQNLDLGPYFLRLHPPSDYDGCGHLNLKNLLFCDITKNPLSR